MTSESKHILHIIYKKRREIKIYIVYKTWECSTVNVRLQAAGRQAKPGYSKTTKNPEREIEREREIDRESKQANCKKKPKNTK